ncbi:hypothetical protein DAEQUDRAFT_810137 [Daedalea quercina L-15889]|uniref:ferric-chelate reductase (NADPH) n=1 Tax=Daedalea quercina L-15889 TaxID=1314783 RepID=A0A165RU01_9APHY|nr:hypothetical protein DAEQUDRAFT_810137 [Daedalea quercina L-15889]
MSSHSVIASAPSSPPPSKPASPSAVSTLQPLRGGNSYDIVVVYVDIVLLGVLGLFVLFALPRTISRLSRASEWKQGLFFYRRNALSPKSQDAFSMDGAGELKYGNVAANIQTVGSHGISDSYRGRSSGPTPRLVAPGDQELHAPKHTPAWSTRFPGISWVLSMQVLPGYSVGKVFLLLSWFGIMLFAGLFNINPFLYPGRAGIIVYSQLPLVFALGTKNNVIGMLIGQGYERLIYLHRFVGRFLVFAANVHAIGIIYEAMDAGDWSRVIYKGVIHWGIVALVCMDILFLLSLSTFVQRFYHIFYISHIVSAVVMLFATCFHYPAARPYIYATAAVYVLDHLLRVLKSRVTTAHLQPIPGLSMVRVQLHAVNCGWRAGQHVRIKVLSMGMGICGWMEPHPFTIASVAESANGEGLTLMCKKAGDWTGKLYALAEGNKETESQMGRDVTVLIDGPYGGPGNTVVTSYSGAMLVTGGSGLAYGLPIVEEFLQKGMQGVSAILVVDLVWSVRSPSHLSPMIPFFTRLLEQAPQANLSLRISVFYTRAVAASALQGLEVLPPGLTLAPGRTPLEKTLESVVESTHGAFLDGKSAPNGVFVGVCGPLALTEEVSNVVRNFDRGMFHAVGGIEVQEESFSW